MENNVQFEKYVNMIRKAAHIAAKSTGVEYEEIEAQGFLIYCECLEKFDVTKGVSFSTFLYTKLMTLAGDARYMGIGYSRGRKTESFEAVCETTSFKGREENPTLENLLESAKFCLSVKAYDVMEWILKRTWETESIHKPKISMVMQKFNIGRKLATKLWDECKLFWINQGCLLYS